MPIFRPPHRWLKRLGVTLAYLFTWLTIPHVLFHKKRPASAMAWVWCIIALPFIGPLADTLQLSEFTADAGFPVGKLHGLRATIPSMRKRSRPTAVTYERPCVSGVTPTISARQPT